MLSQWLTLALKNDDTALICVDTSSSPCHSYKSISQKQLGTWIQTITNVLQSPQVSKPLIVAIALSPFSIEETATMLAVVLSHNWVYVPVDITLPFPKQLAVIRNCSADRLVTWSNSALALHFSHVESVALPMLLQQTMHTLILTQPHSKSWLEGMITDKPHSQPLYVIPTSGSSTGESQGVIGSRVATETRLEWMWREYPFTCSDRVIRATKLSFIDSVWEILGAVIRRVPLVHIHYKNMVSSVVLHRPADFRTILEQSKVTRWTVVPSVLRTVLTRFANQNLSLTLLLVSGEVLTVHTLQLAFERLLSPTLTILNLYGSTEVSGDVTCMPITRALMASKLEKWKKHGVPIGKWKDPRAIVSKEEETTLSIVPDASITGVPSVGKLRVRGLLVAEGYLGRDGRVLPCRRPDGSYDMGDLCFVRDNELFYYGRNDRLVKLHGRRLHLRTVERVLSTAITNALRKGHGMLKPIEIIAVAMTTKNDKECDSLGLVAVGLFQPEQLVHTHMTKTHGVFYMLAPDVVAQVRAKVAAEHGVEYVPIHLFMIPESEIPQTLSGKMDRTRMICLLKTVMRYVDDENLGIPKVVERVLGQRLEWPRDRAFTWIALGGNSLQAALLSWELEQLVGDVVMSPEDVVRIVME